MDQGQCTAVYNVGGPRTANSVRRGTASVDQGQPQCTEGTASVDQGQCTAVYGRVCTAGYPTVYGRSVCTAGLYNSVRQVWSVRQVNQQCTAGVRCGTVYSRCTAVGGRLSVILLGVVGRSPVGVYGPVCASASASHTLMPINNPSATTSVVRPQYRSRRLGYRDAASLIPYLTVRYVRYGMAQSIPYLTVRYGTVRYSLYLTLRYGTVRLGPVLYLTLRYGTVRASLIPYLTVRYG